jgi:murein DD-endopeptidase MepM/ murein hydrolase activator NlpD
MRACSLSYLISDAPTNRLRSTVLRFSLLLLLALLPGAPTWLAAEDQELPVRLRVDREVAQGEVLEVEISAWNLAGLRVELAAADGARHVSTAWRVAAHPLSGEAIWTALVGVPSTAATGTGELLLSLTSVDGEIAERRVPVWIAPGDFRQERIALNGAMSDLRTSDDPRIAEQSRVLWQVIHRIDPTARHHSGRFILPVGEFRYTSFFGDRREFAYIDGGSARSIHNGLDLAAPTGTPIVSPAAGTVVMAEDRVLTGLTIIIEHLPGVFSLYYHLDRLDVFAGDVVAAGDGIGTVGSTGLSTGPHLHWELRVAGVAVDPSPFLERPLVDTAGLSRSLSTLP